MTNSNERVARAVNHEKGVQLAREARDRGEYALAWKHAQAYGLHALDLAALSLPEQYRPKGFNPGMPTIG